MKTINNFITEKLQISRNKVDTALKDYSYIDDMPRSHEKSEEIFNVLKERYDGVFTDIRLMRTGNITLGMIDSQHRVSNGMYNDSAFTLYIYDNNDYIIRRVHKAQYDPHPAKFVEGFKSLSETLAKFESKLTKRGYKLDFK